MGYVLSSVSLGLIYVCSARRRFCVLSSTIHPYPQYYCTTPGFMFPVAVVTPSFVLLYQYDFHVPKCRLVICARRSLPLVHSLRSNNFNSSSLSWHLHIAED
ncbi:hypothetical protein GGU11DRAFT_70139 [Lentinula aff. detonsa]|nr:hypothetical protein GGU11DRAFT_70139 [Lentinula aff. detonsa]